MTLSKTKSLLSGNSNSSNTHNYQECADCGSSSKKNKQNKFIYIYLNQNCFLGFGLLNYMTKSIFFI